jgi:hypothetical protein
MQAALPPPPQGHLAAVPANRACARRGQCCCLHRRGASPQGTAHPIAAAVQPLARTTQLPTRWLPHHHSAALSSPQASSSTSNPFLIQAGSRFCASACCKRMFQVFQMFHRYVVSVSYGCCKSRSGCCRSCNGCTRMLQTSIFNVSFVFSDVCRNFIYLDVAYFLHICLPVLYLDVAYVYNGFKCF